MADKFFRNKVLVDIDEDEASRMRESWIQHIFNSVEKLSAEVYSTKESFNNKLAKSKEEHFKLKEDLRNYVDVALDKLRDEIKEDLLRLSDSIKSVNESHKSISDALTRQELERLSSAKDADEKLHERFKDFEKSIDAKVTPVEHEMWLTKGKLAAWVVVLGILTSAVVTYILRHW